MQITRQADYATRAVLHLSAMEPGSRAATSTIAAKQSIPPSFLAKIISQLPWPVSFKRHAVLTVVYRLPDRRIRSTCAR